MCETKIFRSTAAGDFYCFLETIHNTFVVTTLFGLSNVSGVYCIEFFFTFHGKIIQSVCVLKFQSEYIGKGLPKTRKYQNAYFTMIRLNTRYLIVRKIAPLYERKTIFVEKYIFSGRGEKASVIPLYLNKHAILIVFKKILILLRLIH